MGNGMEKPVFSIIVPIYNVALFLPECLESICNQTYTEFEAILVDDGSTDNSAEICDAYAERDQRLQVIHKQNGGQTSARWAGVREARGEYIVCIDGDDWVSLDYLAVFQKELEKNHSDIVCCGFFYSDGCTHKKMPLPNRKGYYAKDDIEKEIYPILIHTKQAQYFSPSQWAKVFRRELYWRQAQQVNTDIRIGEDVACTIPCIYYADSMTLLSECLYYYRNNDNSMTRSKKPFDWEGPRLIAEHLEKQIDPSKGDFQEQIYRITAHSLFSVIITQFYRNESIQIIKDDIRKHLGELYYAKALEKCRFSGSIKAKMMHYAMKHRMFWLMKIYAKHKK